MRTPEVLALAFFLYLPVAGRLVPGRRALAWRDAASLGLAGAAAALQLAGDGRAATVVRDWAPGAFLIFAYWTSGAYVGRLAARFEARLLRLDRQLLGRALDSLGGHGPRWVLEALELAYVSCYAFVPAGLLWLVLHAPAAADPDRYWTAVLAASLPCYGLLPLLHTRPPRLVEGDLPIDRRRLLVRRLNLAVLENGSVHANTFPSGHVASTLSAALMVAVLLPWAGVFMLVLAAAIAASTVTGRYHYAADTALGVLLALGGFWVAMVQ